MVVDMERDALAASGIKAAGRCRAIALVTAYGLQGTPRSRLVRETINVWFDVLRQCSSKVLGDLRSAWAEVVNSNAGDLIHIPVRGILTNVISILTKAKWSPRTVNCWMDPRGNRWTMSGTHTAPSIVAGMVNQDLFKEELRRASLHYNGKGMAAGIHINATYMVLRNVKQKEYNIKCLLETIISGATWPLHRVHDIYPDVDPVCSRCGTEPETALHCFWTCPANPNIDEEAVRDTQYLINTAVEKHEQCPCLWLRGILPSEYIQVPPDSNPVAVSNPKYIIGSSLQLESGTYYGDASGGTNTKYAEIRRVGCAFVQISSQGNPTLVAHFPLPGDVQTVSRGGVVQSSYPHERGPSWKSN